MSRPASGSDVGASTYDGEMSATYGWRPISPQESTSFDFAVADALAAYFDCDVAELGDNRELTHHHISALRMLLTALDSYDTASRDEVMLIIEAIRRHGGVALTVER